MVDSRCQLVIGSVVVMFGSVQTSAQQPQQRSLAPAAVESLTIDPCTIAPLDQFRFVIGAGLDRALPIVRTVLGERVTVSALAIRGVTCPPMRADLHAVVASIRQADTASTSVQFTALLSATGLFVADSVRASRKPAGLTSASLCVRAVESIRGDERSVITADRARLRAWLMAALRGQCLDITSLVYVYMQRGGTLTLAR